MGLSDTALSRATLASNRTASNRTASNRTPRLGRGGLGIFVLLSAIGLGLVGCGADPPPLDASEPLVERDGSALQVRWSEAPIGQSMPIYAGPAPDRIDRDRPVAQLVDGEARISQLAFEGRPYFEIEVDGDESRIVAERLLPFEGAEHFRDLGGYETEDGRRIRWGRAYRSGQLAELTDEDLEAMDELGIRLVVDFRSDKERAADPDRLPVDPAPRTVLAPIGTPGVDPQEIREKLLSGDLEGLDLASWLVDGNRSFVFDFSDRYRLMFEEILKQDSVPFVVHCTGGKDRAGMASALILLALGVPEDQVMKDFLLTNALLAEVIEQRLLAIRVFSLFRTDPEQVRPLMGVERRYLAAGLDAMREKRGSVDAFLEIDLGMGPTERNRLRELLLEPI